MSSIALMLASLTPTTGWIAVLLALSVLAVFGQVGVPDAGDAGAAADAGDEGAHAGNGNDDGGDEGGDAGDAGDRQAAAGEGDDDLTEDEREREELLASLTPEERERRSRTWNRRQSRQLRSVLPIAERFRGADGRYLTAAEVDRIRARAADQEELEEFFTEHPDLLQEVLKRKQTGGRRAAVEPPATEEFRDPYANEDDLPFDTKTESGKWFLNLARQQARESHDLRQLFKRLEQGLGHVNERDTQRTFQQTETTWKNETLQAAKDAGLKGDDLQDFVNGVYKDFRLAAAEKRLDKVDRKTIIARALRPFQRNRTAVTRRAAADASTRVAGNTTLPRPGNRSAAGPANPKESNRGAGTIRDARKSFFARQSMTPPPAGR